MENNIENKREVVSILREEGYDAIYQEVVQDGRVQETVVIRPKEEGSSLVVINLSESLRRVDSAKEASAEIAKEYESRKDPGFSIPKELSRDYILENIRIGLAPEGDTNFDKGLTIPIKGYESYEGFDDIQAYMYVRISSGGRKMSIARVHRDMLLATGIREKEAWLRAVDNTLPKETEIVNMEEALGEEVLRAMGLPAGENFPVYVVTNKEGVLGASAILDKQALKKIGLLYGTRKLAVFPSSIHEMLVMPLQAGDESEIDEFSSFVREVNAECVEPRERLSSKAYILELWKEPLSSSSQKTRYFS